MILLTNTSFSHLIDRCLVEESYSGCVYIRFDYYQTFIEMMKINYPIGSHGILYWEYTRDQFEIKFSSGSNIKIVHSMSFANNMNFYDEILVDEYLVTRKIGDGFHEYKTYALGYFPQDANSQHNIYADSTPAQKLTAQKPTFSMEYECIFPTNDDFVISESLLGFLKTYEQRASKE